MKKIFLVLLIVIMSTTALNSYAASGEPTIVISDAEDIAGEYVDVTLSLENNPGIAIMFLTLNYDQSALKLDSVTDERALGTTTHNIAKNILYWDDTATGENNYYNGIVITLHFLINENAEAKQYPISVSYDLDNDELLNADFEPVEFAVNSGSITVTSGGGEDDGEPTITAPVSVVQGNNVTIAAELTGTANGGKIIGAMYDASGNMIECHLYDPAQTVNVVFTKSGGSYAEIYWWEDMTSITPACENETVAILAAN